MANPKLLVYFQSGDATQCATAIDGSATGTLTTLSSFVTGYFSNSVGALTIPATVASSSDGWSVTGFNRPSSGFFEGWYKFNGWSLSGTTVSDGVQHRLYVDNGLNTWSYIHPGQGIHFDFNPGSGNLRLSCTTASISADTWFHYRCTWSDELNLRKMFIDGAEVASSTTSFTVTINPATTAFIGHYYAETTQGLNGYVDGFVYGNWYNTDFKDMNNKRRYLNDVVNT